MRNLKIMAIEEYKNSTGIDYDDNQFPNPASVPKDILSKVAEIKVFSYGERNIDIRQELENGNRLGDVLVVDPSKKHLIQELKQVQLEEKKWTEYLL